MQSHEFQTTLGEIASFRRGVSYKGSELAESEADGTPMINMKSFTKEGKYRPEGIKFHNGIFKDKDIIKPDEIVLANTDLTKEGDILGAAIMIPVELHGRSVVGSHHTTILTVNDERVNPTYLARTINSEKNRIEIKRYRRGATVKGITSNDLKKIVIQIPSLDEQKRIVTILDKADEIERTTAKIQEMRNEVIHSIFLEIFENHLNEKLQPLKELVSFSQGKQFGVELQILEPKEGYSRFLRITDYTQGDDIRYVPNEDNKYYVHNNDIVIVRYGASAGFVGTNKEGVLANNLFKVNYDKKMFDSTFLFYIFQHDRFKKFVKKEAFGAAMPALSFKVMERFEIPVPPIKLQNLFADIVQHITSIDLRASKIRSINLKASLSQKLLV